MHDNPYIQFGEAIARRAGEIINDYFYNGDRSLVRQKGDRTPVTAADEAINALLIEELQKTFPDHGVLGEEASYESGRNHLWVCDPIDGTSALIDGVPVSLFSLAYVVDGEPQVAVVYDPFQDSMYTAIKGQGAFRNGRAIHVSGQPTIQGAKIAATGSYSQIISRKQVFDFYNDSGASVILVNGQVFKAMLVAQGYADGLIFPGKSAHDVAASALIIEEAGGLVTDLDGKVQRYDREIRGAILSNGRINGELEAAIASTGSDGFLGY